MKFNGYIRPDGSVGIRNSLLIVGVDECCDGICRAIAKDHDNAIVITNFVTCMQAGNEELLHNIIGVGKNPNIAGVLVVAMGCGSINPEIVAKPIRETGKASLSMRVMDLGGTRKAIEHGRSLAQQLSEEAAKCERTTVPLSKLTVGVKCGGSDASSGLASNPVVGFAADKIIDNGGTVIGGEVIEFIGGEKYLLERCRNDEVRTKLDRIMKAEEKRWSIPGADVEIMSIGNSVGGLTTIEEKTLGALHKFGTHPVEGVLEADRNGIETPDKPGLYLGEVTHLCGASAINFAAMGAQCILWTSGGSGFNNAIVPVIRISGNAELFTEDQDIDARAIMRGEATSDEVGEQLFAKVIEVANGAETAVEGLGYAYCSIYQKDQRLEGCLGLLK
ncbi:UxaA family hydrolase [Halodesulfovibrio marinisediminis]|uniref:Altronate dehydratase large subunit n=1 Tax=Halodesulfovibrio marinisediminis DSM 17456 TaxID=1121457 RepID=A0A1N6DVL2_9BACT|nr:UxaA family hydrolase [Halodesulfovibrio marinisediminis]SIN74835.1 altronate dehydratase large subunit [Halodesulfovibrio marinisediminis DSM 17456]